jgi:hypothetical protein
MDFSDLEIDDDMRTCEQLIEQWPEIWKRFDAIVKENLADNLSVVQEMLRYLLELSRSEPDDEEVDKVLAIVLVLVQDERILPSQGELIAIVAFSLDLFSTLMDQHPEKCAPHIDLVMTKVVSLILGLAAIPTFGKKVPKAESTDTKVVKKIHGANTVNSESDDEEDEDEDDDEDDDEPLSDDASRLFVWNQCCNVIMSVLEYDEHRSTVGKIANTIIGPVTQFIVDSDYVQLKVEASELLEQLLVLSYSPKQVALYDCLIHEESPLDSFLNEEDEEDDPSELLGTVQKDDHHFDAYPFFQAELAPAKVEELMLYLIKLSAEGGPELAETNLESIIGALAAVTTRFEPEVSGKIIQSSFDLIKKLIGESNDILEKLPPLSTLKEIFSFAPDHIVQANFMDMLTFIEGICAQELRKLKPVGGGKKNQRGGGGGRGGRGRGRGGGGGPPKPDPEKEMQFKVIQRQLAFTLEKLFLKGGQNLLSISEKFFNTTSSSFKSHDMHFAFLCAFGVELAKPDSAAHPNFEAQKKLLATKLEASYKAMSDNLGSKFVSVKSKIEGCKCISRISSTCLEGVPVFPEYLPRTLYSLLDVATKDAIKVGPSVFVYLEHVIKANKKSEVLQAKIGDILTTVNKYLAIPEGKEEDEVYNYLQLVGCEVIELIYFQKELHNVAKPLIPVLAPALKSIVKGAGDRIKEYQEELEAEEEEDEDDDMLNRVTEVEDDDEAPSLISIDEANKVIENKAAETKPAEASDAKPLNFDFSGLSLADKPKEDKPATATPTFNFGVAPTTQPATSPFNFNFGTAATGTTATTTATLTTQSFPKFDFGGASAQPSAFVAPTFNFGAPVATTGTSLGGTAVTIAANNNSRPVVNAGRGGAAARGPARGAGGRGRGRQLIVEDDEDDDEDDDDDDDDDEDDDDEDDDDDDDDEEEEEDDEEDPMGHDASLCFSILHIVNDMAAIDGENQAFKELLAQSLETAKFLENTQYGGEVSDFLENFEAKEEGEK